MVTLREISQMSGVSISVVSRTLNRNPDKNAWVSDSTRARVIAAAEELGYQPNRAAEFLKRGGSAVIGVFLPKFRDALVADLVFGISAAAKEEGFPVAFHFGLTRRSYQKFLKDQRNLPHCGIITYPYTEKRVTDDTHIAGIVKTFVNAGGKMIVINPHTDYPETPSISVNEYEGGCIAARRFLERGCQDCFLLHPYWGRTEGFVETLEKAGKTVLQFKGDAEGIKAMSQAVKESILREQSPVGVFVTSDNVALRALGVFNQLGIRVGEEVLLIGYNDLSFTQYTTPPLTTIRQPLEKVGAAAVHAVIERIYGQTVRSQEFSPRLVERESA